MQTTKALNRYPLITFFELACPRIFQKPFRMIKKKGISKERAKQIKQERRTLKNRGYAANCRVKRENEEKLLEEKNKQLRRDIYWQQVRLEDSKNELKELTNKLNQLTDTCVHMKREEEELQKHR